VNDRRTDPPRTTRPTRRAIRVVAFFEAFKGIIILVAGSGLLSLVHKDIYDVATVFLHHIHLNPASRYPQIFLDAASKITDTRLLLLALGAAAYASVRLVEAYGLYLERSWAELLAAVSGGIYVPFEVYGLIHRPTWHGAVLLVVNIIIVALMVHALLQRRKAVNRPA
jgi:uncharacterized membrane protein (DUF2068 family)